MTTPHALVVGGSGMLAGTSLALASQGYAVSVIARSQTRLAQLAARATSLSGEICPIPLDYCCTEPLTSALHSAIAQRGPFSKAALWIHSTAPDAPLHIAKIIAQPNRCDLVHVLGSAHADPARKNPDHDALFTALKGLRYRRAILGFVPLSSGRSRWLTDQEISRGVAKALDSDQLLSIVGAVEPWSARP